MNDNAGGKEYMFGSFFSEYYSAYFERITEAQAQSQSKYDAFDPIRCGFTPEMLRKISEN